jgi:hypothetical protein
MLKKALLQHLQISNADGNDEPGNSKTPAWHTAMPYLRLYCCLTLDDVKVHMADQFCVMDKAQLSARNSDVRPQTYFELLAEKFNDPLITFTTESLPQLHMNFAEPIHINFKDMPGKTNAEQMKRKVSGCRAALAQVSTSVDISFMLFWPLTHVLYSFLEVVLHGSTVEMERVNVMKQITTLAISLLIALPMVTTEHLFLKMLSPHSLFVAQG